SELAEWLAGEYPDLGHDRYRFSVLAWARAETISALLVHYLDDISLVDEAGEVRDRLLQSLRAAERRAAEGRENLGLDPVAHAALEKRRAEAVRETADLDAIRAAGRQSLDRHREKAELVERQGRDGERLEER